MYYSHPCSYCHKVFYVHADSKDQASKALYAGIKQHLIDYGEDEKEHEFDDGPSVDTNEVYGNISESNDPPSGGYPL